MKRLSQTLLILAIMLAASPALAAERAFLMVETANIDASEAWYSRAFELKRVNRADRPKFDQRILAGDDLIVELAQLRPPSSKASGRKLGLTKAGMQVADFDQKLAKWRASGIAQPHTLIFDEALGLATILLQDPDGNVIQVFGKSAGPFDATVKVNPEFKAK